MGVEGYNIASRVVSSNDDDGRIICVDNSLDSVRWFAVLTTDFSQMVMGRPHTLSSAPVDW
jgi:hypothetical protein